MKKIYLLTLFAALFGSGISAQNVGIGTTTPAEKLHVLGGQTRSDNAQFGNGRNNDGRLKFLNNGWGRIGAENGLSIWANGNADIDDNPAMHIDSMGRVGIGTVLLQKGLLEVNGFANHNPGNFVFYARDGGNAPTMGGITGQVIDISIYCSNRVVAKEFDAHSDARIKRIEGVSDAGSDLRTLMGIEVTDYRMKDQLAGQKAYKKVIAQQVRTVYPQATSLITEVVPDLFALAKIREGRITLSNNLKTGERVRLIFPDRTELLPVLSADADGFKVAVGDEGEVFVYGREVDDFHVVDYEAISMLNVSATQAQQRLIESQQSLIQTLQEENASLRRSSSEQESRLLRIENELGIGQQARK